MFDKLPILFFAISIIAITFFVFFKFKINKNFSFARTFIFECNNSSSAIKVSFVFSVVFSICSVLEYLNLYFYTFTNSYILLATIGTFIICIMYILLNLVNLVNLKAHFIVFSVFAALITTQSVVLGFQAINTYNIAGNGVAYIILAVFFFIEAALELLLVSPVFKFSFLMEVSEDKVTLKKPTFIRLAFYEWLFLFLFIFNTFLLLVEKIV